LLLWLILKGIISIDLGSFLSAGPITTALLAETAGQAISAGFAAYLSIRFSPKPYSHFSSREFQSLLARSRPFELGRYLLRKIYSNPFGLHRLFIG
jgi:hypothetical protein